MILCINKFRDNSGKIVGYRLQDNDDMAIQDVEASFLKDRMQRGMVKVANLKLTSDGRLVDCNPYGKPDNENKIMIQEFRNGKLRGTIYMDGDTPNSELQRRLNGYGNEIQAKVSNITVSNINPVKEIKVRKFNKDGTYEAKGLHGLMNMITKHRDMRIKGLEYNEYEKITIISK